MSKGKYTDLSGRKYGRLTVIKRVSKPGMPVRWRCRCDCGRFTTATTGDLQSGHKKSCGCLTHGGRKPRPAQNDLTGKRFGKLTVVRRLGYDRRRGDTFYLCRCDCGCEVEVRHGNLTGTRGGGHTTSCGCARDAARRASHTEERERAYIRKLAAKPRSDNKSGRTGVYWKKDKQRWHATINYMGKTYSLGNYHDLRDAISAREDAEIDLFGEVLV